MLSVRNLQPDLDQQLDRAQLLDLDQSLQQKTVSLKNRTIQQFDRALQLVQASLQVQPKTDNNRIMLSVRNLQLDQEQRHDQEVPLVQEIILPGLVVLSPKSIPVREV